MPIMENNFSKISQPTIVKDATLAAACVSCRCSFDIGGVGQTGYTPTLKITNVAGSNVTPLTLDTHWRRVEQSNIAGDYEIIILLSKFTSFGTYTIEVDSGNVDAGKLTAYFTIEGQYCTVQTDAGNSTTQLKTDLPSSTNNFYNTPGLVLPMTGALAGTTPVKITGYTGATKIIAFNALTGIVAAGEILYIIRY